MKGAEPKGSKAQTSKKSQLFKGSGRRPQFHALWHLKELGVVESMETFQSPAWAAVRKSIDQCDARPVRVAIIDTLPAFTHPNLVDRIDREAFQDFSDPENPKTMGKLPDPKSQDIAFGAHGTAVAGLIAAHPRNGIDLQMPQNFVNTGGDDSYLDDKLSPSKKIALPYCGINPFAKIVPLVVSEAPDPAMIQKALDHAIELAQKDEIDIVVIAASWDRDGTPYPDNPPPDSKQDGLTIGYGSKINGPPPLGHSSPWEIVDEKLMRLCRLAYVFCAAGNEPRSRKAANGQLVYPASQSKLERGPWAVGACDYAGEDLTYTPNSVEARKAGHRLITTLSSEHPRFDDAKQRLDPWAKLDEELDMPEWLFQRGWPAQDIVSTDVPGPEGYNPSPYDHVPAEKNEKHLEIASLFCRFSGTSAATAIAAGLVSLALALKKAGKVKENSSENPYKGPDVDELFTLDQAKVLVRMQLPREVDRPAK